MRTLTAVLRPIASTMRFAHLTELSLAPCAARRLWARTRSSSIPQHLHGSQRRLQCRTRLGERFSDLFLLLSGVELGRNGARGRQKFTIPKFDLASKCRGAPTNGLKAKTLRSRSTPGAAQSYSSSWTRSARRSRLPRRTSHSRSTSTVGRIRCSRPSSGCATQQPRSHPRASSWRLRRRRPTTLHAPTTRPMWQAVGRWGQARQRGGPRQRRTAARERWVSVVRRVARVKRHHSNARRGTRAHVPSAYRRRCG